MSESVSSVELHKAIFIAVQNNDLDMLKLITDKQSHIRNHESKTLIMVAAELGLMDVIDILLQKHADINAVDFYHGQTALMLAILSNQDTVFIQQLIHRGADPNIFSTEEYNAIMYAVRQKNLDIVSILIHEGCLFKMLIDILVIDYPGKEKRFSLIYCLLSLKYNQAILYKNPSN